MSSQKIEQKEGFCPACVTVPIALAAGGGMTAYGSSQSSSSHKRFKMIMLISGILTLLCVFWLLLRSKKSGGCNGTCPV